MAWAGGQPSDAGLTLSPGCFGPQVFDHMALLQSWFQEQSSKQNSLSELYERVQWAGNVLPRLCAPCPALSPSRPPPTSATATCAVIRGRNPVRTVYSSDEDGQ